MKHRCLWSGTFAFIVGIIGVMGLLAVLSLPAAAQPNAAWHAIDRGQVLPAQPSLAAAVAVEPVEAALSLPPLDRSVTIPPTRSLPYRGSDSIPAGVSRSSTPPVYHAGFNTTSRGSSPHDSPVGHAASLTAMDPRATAELGALGQATRSMLKSSQESIGAPLAPPMPGSADLAICLDTDRVWGVVSAGDTVTVAVDNIPMGAYRADAKGFFWTTLYAASGQRPGLTAGDDVAIYQGTATNVTLRSIDAQIDLLNDVVYGTIGGVSSPIAVTVYVPWGEPSTTSYSRTVNTDAAGNFSADMSSLWDLTSEDTAAVSYVENGVEVHRHVYPSHSLMVRAPWQVVRGFAAPGSPVTVTVYLSDSVSVKAMITTTTALDLAQGGWGVALSTNLVESDIVVARFADGMVLSRTVDPLTIDVDPLNDQLTGQAKPGALIVGTVDDLTAAGWRTILLTTTATAGGDYLLDFSGSADIMPGRWGGVYVPDAEGDDLNLYNNSPAIEVDQTWNEVHGRGGLAPIVPDGQPVTLTLYSSVSAVESSYVSSLDPYNGYAFTNENGFAPDIVPGDVITVESGGWTGVVHVMTLTVQVDPDGDQFTGTVASPTSRVELAGNYNQPQLYPANGQFALLGTAASGTFTLSPAGFDVRGDLAYNVAHRTTEDYLDRISRRTDVLGALISWNTYGGVINPPGTSYTVTLYDNGGNFKAQLTGQSAEPTGNLWQDFWSTGQQIEPGDHLQLQSAAGFSYTAIIPTLIITPDLAANTVSGYGPANTLLLVSVDNQGQGFVPTDGSGRFAVAVNQLQELWGDGSLEWGESVWVNYYDENNTWLVDVFNWPNLTAHYDMEGNSAVWGGNVFPSNTILITVTHPVSGVIATATTTAGGCDWCGPADYWVELPFGSIVPGESVTVNFGDDYLDTITVAALTAQADVADDLVTGTAPENSAVWLNVNNPFGGSANLENIPVDASGVFTADFGGVWDIWYGDSFDVSTPAPHGHSTSYGFWLPTPDLSVNKWNPSGGQAQPGGVMVYAIQYSNWGNGAAANTIITDTLPLYTTYVADTSGITPEIGADGVITWNLGTLTPNTDRYFMVTLAVSSGAPTGSGVIPDNCVGIATTSLGDVNPDNDRSCTGPVDVQNDEVEIGVDKWPTPNDPAPGEEFEYTLRVCNNRGAAAGPIWLTDTLPLSTTLISWWPENQQNNYWTEVSSTGSQLVLYAPGFSGNMCDHVRVRLQVAASVPVFTTLINSLAAAVEGDVDLSNNQRTNTIRTSPPRYDVNLNKNTNNAVLVPGGWINYHIDYYNQGNSPVHAWVTDTLPAGTTYQPDSAHEQNGGPLFPPALIAGQTVVWDLGTIGVGQGYGLDFSIDISSTLTPGTVLTNCATIGLPMPDDAPWDNTRCVAETINDHGPNLRVFKRGYWENNYQQLRYDAQFQNAGDQPLDHVWVTDTLPAATTFAWLNLGFDWGRVEANPQSPTMQQFEFSTLYPGDSGWLFFSANLDDFGARPRWYTNAIEIDTPPGDVTPADNLATTVNLHGEVNRVELRVTNRLDLWGQAQPNRVLTVTTAYTEVTTSVDNWGNWNLYQEGSSIQPGDTVTVTAGDGTLPVVIQVPTPFDIQADSITDRVWGQIDSLDQQLIDIDLAGYLTKIAQTDNSGSFTRFFADVPRGGNGEVRYATTIASTDVVFHRDFQSPDLILTVDYDHDWVETSYEAGHTIWLTVTDSVGVVKATMVDTTQVVPWWNGGTGFSTNMGAWQPVQPDIAIGDWVYGAIDTGYTASVRMGTIDGVADATNDSIAGTITVPWFTQLLNAQCWIDGVNNSNQDFTVNPAGGSYSCDFAPNDLLPGQNVSVQYQEPDGDWVRNVFREPAARLNIQTWGNNQPGAGGNYAFTVRYDNQGEASAVNTVITSTLEGVTYLADGSGSPAFVTGNVITWNVGTVPANSGNQFDIFVQVDAAQDENITHTVSIGTDSFDQTDGVSKLASWSATVQAGDANINVGAGTWTWQPAPGYDYIYTANVCNNGSTGTAAATLTNTLPLSTSLVNWWGQTPGWVQVLSDTHELVVSRLTLAGGQCDQVYVRVHLDPAAMLNDPLHYHVEVETSNDSNPGDNQSDLWHNVGGPYYDLSLSKNWNWGQLVPGGEVRYNLNYNNNGSLPITTAIRLTDTLPQNTTFLGAWTYDQQGQHPVTPTTIAAGYVVWEISSLDNGFGRNFEIALRLSSGIAPGTVFTNCATIAADYPEYNNPYDNAQCVAETVRASGPNLRVTKTAEWQNGGNQLQYRVRLENISTTTIAGVTVTDTYPSALTLDWWNINWWPWSFNHDALNHVLTVTLDSPFNPGNVTDLTMQFNVPGVPHGTLLTNTVEITTPPGDVNPADNAAQQVSGTGPDLSVEKWLAGGSATPRPGDLLTYTLHLANQSSQWWTSGQVLITDTLPDGLEFVNALQRLCSPGEFFCESTPTQSGSVLSWVWGTWCPNCWNDLILTVRVANTAQSGDVLTNTAQIASDNPTVDVEPDYADNRSEVAVRVLNPQFVVSKVYQGNRVAGTAVTYTLTVTNQGNYTGTNVRLIDQLPAAMTYGGSGGLYGDGWITWTLPSVNPFGGTATAWFSGTLACTAGTAVSNQNYRVESSDQGVTSTNGSPVSFAISAPAITASIVHGPEPALVNSAVLFTATAGTDGTPLSYAWNFGDGATASGLTASHVYTHDGSYTAIFTATDECNFTRVQTSTVTVNPPTINANFTQSATSVVVSTTVSFTDTSTTNVPPLAAWEWDFGDGTPHVFTPNASHTFMTPGVRTVRLIVTDTLGYSAFHTSAVTVNPPTISANFNQSTTSVVVSTSVNFTDTSTTNLPPLAAWEWDFGDGTPHVFTQNANHTFMTLGVHTVRLTVTDTLGYSAFHTNTVTVNAPTIIANFTQSTTNVVVNSTVRFTDTSSTNGPPLVAWGWDFGDGSLSTTQHPTHTYTTSGSYTVTLLITDSLGYTATRSVINAVIVQPPCTSLTNVAFTFAPIKPLIHTSVAFTATIAPIAATPPITYVWSFGDSSVVTNTMPTMQHTYQVIGTQTSSVTAYNACTPQGVSAQNTITIDPYRIYLPLAVRN